MDQDLNSELPVSETGLG